MIKKSLVVLLKDEVKNPDIKEKLLNLNQMSEASKMFTLIYATHGLLYSSYGNKTKKHEKNSIKSSFNYIMSFLENESLVGSFIEQQRDNCIRNKCTLQPFIIAIGTGLESLNSDSTFLLCFDNFKYKINDPDKIFEVYLKVFMLFELKFEISTKNVLEFYTTLLFNYPYDLTPKTKSLVDLVKNYMDKNINVA